MRKQLASLTLSTLFGLGVAIAAPQAQNTSTPAQNTSSTERHPLDANRQVKMLSKRLNLSVDQQNEILPILTSREQQIENIRSDSSLSQPDRHQKMRAVREASENQIRALLTDTQKQTFDQMQQRMRERARERREQRQNSGQGTGAAS